MTESYFGLKLRHKVPGEDGHVHGKPVEMKFVGNGEDGDVVLEQGPDGFDPDTLVEIDGETYEFTLNMSATLPTEDKDGAKQIPDEFEGETVLVITIHDYPDPGKETQMMFMPYADASEKDMEEFGRRHFDFQDIDTTPAPVPVCFVAGTMIETPTGPRPVEDIRAGDEICLADGKIAKPLWVSNTFFPYARLVSDANTRPVCIPAGSLGVGVPGQDLWVSQQHRIALRGWELEVIAGVDAAFAHAKHLAAQPTLPGLEWRDGVNYVHLLFEAHEVLLANGTEADSLFLGEQAVENLDAGDPQRFLAGIGLNPDIAKNFVQTTLPTLKEHEVAVWKDMVSYGVDLEKISRMAA